MAGRRQTILIFAALAALVAGGWDACRREAPVAGARLLDYVPGDTIFFAGQTQAALLGELGAKGSGVYGHLLGLVGAQARAATRQAGPAAGVLVALLRQQQAAVGRGERPFAAHGMPADGVMAAYTVGQTPVLRWELGDARRFWRSVNEAERAAGLELRERTRGAFRLRRYTLELGELPAELVLAAGEGFALAALHVADGAAGEAAPSLDEILGIERPADPLDRVALDNLARAYGLVPGTVAFVDNGRLFASLRGSSSAGLLEHAARLTAAADLDLPAPVRALGSDACRDEVALLPEFWSRTVTGVTGAEPEDREVAQRLVFESDHQRALAGLEGLRGHIPALVRAPDTMLGLGLGVDLTTLLEAPEARAESDEDEADDQPPEDDEAGEDESGDEASARPAAVSDCAPIAAVQRRMAGSDAAPGPLARMLPKIEGIGGSVFRILSPAGLGAASAVMIATEDADAVHDALQRAVASAPAWGSDPSTYRPWRAARETTDVGRGREQGLLLASSELVLAQPETADEPVEAPAGLLAFRYRQGMGAEAIGAALAPWLEPLPPKRRRHVARALQALDALPFDLAVDLRVGDTGLELDLVVTPVAATSSTAAR